MRGTDRQQSTMFSYLSPEKRVPGDHPLRTLRPMVDDALGKLTGLFDGMYAAEGEQRIHYEFQRGEVMFVSPKGEVEVRLVAVDSETGEVGTRTIAHFHTRYLGLIARCEAELRGTGQLFPPPSRTSSKRLAVPKGEVNLRFGKELPPSAADDDEEDPADDGVAMFGASGASPQAAEDATDNGKGSV